MMILTTKLKIFLLLILSCGWFHSTTAQFTITGQDPSGIQWRQINTEHFKLVYDSVYEKEAQRIAAIYDYTSGFDGNTLHQEFKKLPILIHNHNAISNGMVVWAPKRMELYTPAPQDMYAQGWFEQLALHESRHVNQINRINISETFISSILFGQVGTAYRLAQIPSWFLEGDAVSTETALSDAGRGRDPSFEMAYRAQILEKKELYNFRKAVFGSYNDYIPNYYELGYLMVAYNRSKYGPQFWENILDYTGDNFLSFTPFLGSIKSQTGLNRVELYNRTFIALDSLWRSKSQLITYTHFKKITTAPKKFYTTYHSPCLYGDKIVAYKVSMDNVAQLVSIDTNSGKEEVLFTPGNIITDRISLANGFVYWDEYLPDVRWDLRNYSVVRCFDLQTKKSRFLTYKTMYYAPVAAPTTDLLAVVAFDERGNYSIRLINSKNGLVVKSFSTPENAPIQLPSWNETSDLLVMTLVNTKGKSLVTLNVQTGEWKTIIEPGNDNIAQPVFNKNFIYFSSSHSGIGNIYAINLDTKKIFQVTSSKFGGYNPIINSNGSGLYYMDYTSQGYNIVFSNIDSSKWILLDSVKNVSIGLADKISAQEPVKFDPSKVTYKKYESGPYHKYSHLINIHSWAPFYYYSNPLSSIDGRFMYGYMFASQNLLGTVTATGGQGYYHGRLYSSADVTYQGLFPVFTASLIHGDEIYRHDSTINPNYSGKSFQIAGQVSFPLNFSSGNWTRSFIPNASIGYLNSLFRSKDSVLYQGKKQASFSASFSNYRNMARKDILPTLGLSATVLYSFAPGHDDIFSPQTVASAKLFLPGLLSHHSLRLSYSFENQDLQHYFASNQLLTPRGYELAWYNSESIIKSMNTVSADYVFPLGYPDKTFLKVMYIKRIWASLFFESSAATNYNNKTKLFYDKTYSALGFEMYFDYNLFFLPIDGAPIFNNFGIRPAYNLNTKQWMLEFTTNINLLNF